VAGDVSPDMALIDPRKPLQNGATESFNAGLRDECLSMGRFRNRIEARIVIPKRHQHYNGIGSDRSLGNQIPAPATVQLRNQKPFSRIEWSKVSRQGMTNSTLPTLPIEMKHYDYSDRSNIAKSRDLTIGNYL
jgi:hypothetical protein